MGKSTISMAMFNSNLFVYQRVNPLSPSPHGHAPAPRYVDAASPPLLGSTAAPASRRRRSGTAAEAVRRRGSGPPPPGRDDPGSVGNGGNHQKHPETTFIYNYIYM